MPQGKRSVTTYLVLERASGRRWNDDGRAIVVRHAASAPPLARGQVVVKVTVEVEDVAFEPRFVVPPLSFDADETLRATVTKESSK